MAKAQFHKNQRVYVKPVGTWALIERVVPHWTKGLSEPLRVHYDVGLGREFAAEELQAEETAAGKPAQTERVRSNYWQKRFRKSRARCCGASSKRPRARGRCNFRRCS